MYDLITDSTNLKKYQVERVILSPERWNTYVSYTSLVWSTVKFDKDQKHMIPNDKGGIYTFVVRPDIADHPCCSYLLYVGKTEKQNLRTRFMQYFYEENKIKGRPLVKKMISLWNNNLYFCYTPIDDRSLIHNVENSLIGAYMPPINNEFPSDIKQAIGAW